MWSGRQNSNLQFRPVRVSIIFEVHIRSKPRKLINSSEQMKGYIWLRLVTICNLEVIRRKLYLSVI